MAKDFYFVTLFLRKKSICHANDKQSREIFKEKKKHSIKKSQAQAQVFLLVDAKTLPFPCKS